jgi:hypothetical protein
VAGIQTMFLELARALPEQLFDAAVKNGALDNPDLRETDKGKAGDKSKSGCAC